jgi:hypothetical protein
MLPAMAVGPEGSHPEGPGTGDRWPDLPRYIGQPDSGTCSAAASQVVPLRAERNPAPSPAQQTNQRRFLQLRGPSESSTGPGTGRPRDSLSESSLTILGSRTRPLVWAAGFQVTSLQRAATQNLLEDRNGPKSCEINDPRLFS